MIEAKQTHCGQYRRYDDFYRVWEIHTDEQDKEKVLSWCRDNLYKGETPESAEWHKNIAIGGVKEHDMGYYFGGYYKLEKVNLGYIFTVCEPYAD